MFFSFILGLSAFLLFTIQPMVAKLILPSAGGTPAVWNCCTFFFSTTLLLGYWYVDKVVNYFRFSKVLLLQAMLIFLGLLLVFLNRNYLIDIQQDRSMALQIVGYLTWSIGFPVFVLSTTAPLLQCCFVKGRFNDSRDPYFLYVASNVGSFVALIIYPAVLEPFFTLSQQRNYWMIGYAILATGIVTLLSMVKAEDGSVVKQTETTSRINISLAQKLHWLFCAFLPVSFMLSVTTSITTDITPMPLFWLIPLGIYLVTFIISFSTKPFLSHDAVLRCFPIVLIALVPVVTMSQSIPALLCILFYVGMFCHGTLAASRPESRALTTFYLLISVGGALGGMFNAFLAPLLFTRILELPLTAGLLPVALPLREYIRVRKISSYVSWAVIGITLVILFPFEAHTIAQYSVISKLMVIVLFGSIVLFIRRDPIVLTGVTTLSIMLFISFLSYSEEGLHTIDIQRNFYGSKKIAYGPERSSVLLISGNTTHGFQSLLPVFSNKPSSYYSLTGPVGDVMSTITRMKMAREFGIVGLGTGSMSCHMRDSDRVTYYELDPQIVAIANNQKFFSYLSRCPTVSTIKIGDGRKLLEKESDDSFSLIMIDAFSSDSIPAHLLTKEALALYFTKLKSKGVILFHLSNRFLDLEPVVSGLSAQRGSHALIKKDFAVSKEQALQGKSASMYMLVTESDSFREHLVALGWSEEVSNNVSPLWSDDHSSVLPLLNIF